VFGWIFDLRVKKRLRDISDRPWTD
jgi:hypothetical protein